MFVYQGAEEYRFEPTLEGEFIAHMGELRVMLVTTLPDSWASVTPAPELPGTFRGVPLGPLERQPALAETLKIRGQLRDPRPLVVLGHNALRRALVRFGFTERTLRISPFEFGAAPQAQGGRAVDLALRFGFPTLEARLDGAEQPSRLMLLDTASHIAYWPAADLPNAAPSHIADWHPYCGEIRPKAEQRRLTFGRDVHADVRLAQLPGQFEAMLRILDCAGSLGLPFLSAFAWAELRLAERKLILGPTQGAG